MYFLRTDNGQCVMNIYYYECCYNKYPYTTDWTSTIIWVCESKVMHVNVSEFNLLHSRRIMACAVCTATIVTL